MRFRNTGQIKSVAYSTKKSEIRDGLEIYCVAYKKKRVYSISIHFWMKNSADLFSQVAPILD